MGVSFSCTNFSFLHETEVVFLQFSALSFIIQIFIVSLSQQGEQN